MSVYSDFSSGGKVAPQLAVDLDYPSTLVGTVPSVTVSGLDASSGPLEILGLSGKFLVSLLKLSNVTAETITVKLTIDGTVVWDDTFTSSTTLTLYNNNLTTATNMPPFLVQSSLSLELTTATDTSVELTYAVVPIL